MNMKDLDNLSVKIMLYTRVEISLQELKDARRRLSDAIMNSREGETVNFYKTGIVASLDEYLDALHDYNSFIKGRLSGDVVKRYFVNDIDATSKLIQTLKESM